MRYGMLGVWLVGCAQPPEGPWRLPDLEPLPLDESVEARVDGWIDAMTLEEKVTQMHGDAIVPQGGLWPTRDNERLGIPGLTMVDGPRGLTAGEATAFPVAMARAATFDTALERAVGEAIGKETRAVGADVILAPAINVLRHPAWGRAQETYGEDPFLLGAMGVAFVHGAQEHVIASAKHFIANSIEDSRFEVDVTVGEAAMREVYGRAFRAVVREGGVGSVMSAYNKVNGTYCAENAKLLQDLLRDTWGFRGFVESDWALGTRSTVPSLKAGLDIEMPAATFYGSTLAAVVENGVADEALVDASVRRILRTKLAFDIDRDDRPPRDVIASAAHADLAREVARRGMVLLRNDDGLPLQPGASIVVVGALADAENIGDVGSSNVTPPDVVTFWEGIDAGFPDRATLVPTDTLDADARAALDAADVAIVVVGLTAADEGENIEGRPGGDRETLALSADQQQLIADAVGRATTTILVVQGGSAVVFPEAAEAADAWVMAWYAGQEGGHALADLLSGAHDFTGRLPVTFPATDDQLGAFDGTVLETTYDLWHGYTRTYRDQTTPAFPFGHGLSYGRASIEAVEARVIASGDVEVEVTLAASDDRDGHEVVQVYVHKPDTAYPQLGPRLAAVAPVAVPVDATETVTLSLPIEAFARFDVDESAWVVERGEHAIEVGRSYDDRFERRMITVVSADAP